MTTIIVPDWARIDNYVMVKDTRNLRGNGPNEWYREKIIGYGYNGIFHQKHNCPVYYSRFDEWGKTIKEDKYI